MSIFPSEVVNISGLIQSTITNTKALPLAKDYAWDFDLHDFKIIDGRTVVVTGKEAVKVWIWKALKTKKNRYRAYTETYGNELESLINQTLSRGASRSEIERYLKEALLINPYITGVKNIKVEIDGSRTDVSFTTLTIYGEVSINV